MKTVNLLLTLLSLNAVLIIIERLSPTTKIFLQPYNFLRLHEVFQMTVVIALSIIISFLLLKTLSNNFENLKTRKGTILGIIFILGLYFTATGNGLHEVSSYIFNTFCDTKNITQKVCLSAFFNDYYFGNILYFIGLFMSNISLVFFERIKPNTEFTKKDIMITIANGIIYALTLFAYAAFDRVLVGMGIIIISAIVIDILLFTSKAKYRFLPFTVYSAIGYTLSTILTIIVRFR